MTNYLAKTLQKAVWFAYQLDKVVANSVDVVLSIYAEEIKEFQQMVTDLYKQIEKVIKVTDDKQILCSIYGIRTVYALIFYLKLVKSIDFTTKLN